MRKYAEFFVDLCLQEYEFRKFDSLTLAISVIIAARKTVGLEPLWHAEFDVIFNWDAQKVSQCYSKIYRYYKASFPEKYKEKSAKKSDLVRR